MPVDDVYVTDAIVDGVLAALAEGRSDQDVGMAFGVTLYTVEVIRGMAQRREEYVKPKPWTPESKAWAVQMKERGWTYSQIAKRLGRSAPGVSNMVRSLRKNGKLRKRGVS